MGKDDLPARDARDGRACARLRDRWCGSLPSKRARTSTTYLASSICGPTPATCPARSTSHLENVRGLSAVSRQTGIEMLRGNSNRLIPRLAVTSITVLQVHSEACLADPSLRLLLLAGFLVGYRNSGHNQARHESAMITDFEDGCRPLGSGASASSSVTSRSRQGSAANDPQPQSGSPTAQAAARIGGRRR